VTARDVINAAEPGDAIALGEDTHAGPVVIRTGGFKPAGKPGVRVNGNAADWTPQWTKAPELGPIVYASPIPWQPVTMAIDGRVMIDADESRSGLTVHTVGSGRNGRDPVGSVFPPIWRRSSASSFPPFATPTPPSRADRSYHQGMRLSITLACILVCFASFCAGADSQRVRLIVRVPTDTPADASVCIAGSLAAVGNWKADGVNLVRQPDGTFAGDIDLAAGETLEYKITLGTWETVERRGDGGDRPNRVVTIAAGANAVEAVVERWAAGPQARPSTVVGTLKLHTIASVPLEGPRTIRVWLPPGYDADPIQRHGVLYLHDGQNLFDRATSAFGNEWQIDETLTDLIHAGRVPPVIVVGLDNGGAARIAEYTFDADPKHGGGGGERHAAFLLDEVRPLVDRTYRTRTGKADTFVGGSSLGGLLSLEIARRHGDAFGGVLAMSPSLWWAGESTLTTIERDAAALRGARVWLDTGTREEPGEAGARHVYRVRRLEAALGRQQVDRRLTVVEGAGHNEAAWADRFPAAAVYLLGRGDR
jgi:predicted alpha/beta superfamily hydrolase